MVNDYRETILSIPIEMLNICIHTNCGNMPKSWKRKWAWCPPVNWGEINSWWLLRNMVSQFSLSSPLIGGLLSSGLPNTQELWGAQIRIDGLTKNNQWTKEDTKLKWVDVRGIGKRSEYPQNTLYKILN